MRWLCLWTCLLLAITGSGQEVAYPDSKQINTTTGLWQGLYTKYRLSERMFYYGEYHYRRRNNFVNEIAQLYLRFGATYLVSKKFEVTAGIVTPLYWAPQSLEAPHREVVPQYRLWQQWLFVQEVSRLKFYHQIRTEQRWKRDYEVGSPFKLTHRFRYKLSAYWPLNKPIFTINTLFLSFYEEIFIQAGKPIVYDHLEDNRIFLGLGYIINNNLQIQAGHMWTFRHQGSPFIYESRHIPRISLYHNIDFYYNRLKRRKTSPVILDSNF